MDTIGLVPIRYHKDTTPKALERWEHIDVLLESSRRLRAAYETIQEIDKTYNESLDSYVAQESNRWLKKINEYFIEIEYEWRYRKAIKNFSKIMESIKL